MDLENAKDLILNVLERKDWKALKIGEEELKREGITIPDDFIETDQRRSILEGMRLQFSDARGPSILLTGHYGCGKTFLLARIIRDMTEGSLKYGPLALDPISVALNTCNTLSLFLKDLLTGIATLQGNETVVGTYARVKAIADLPDLPQDSVEGVRQALVSLHIANMASVLEYLEELFRAYKRNSNNQRILTLVLDELEMIAERVRDQQDEEVNKLDRLLKLVVDRAVRDLIDSELIVRDPHVSVFMAIISRAEALESGLMRQDRQERAGAIEFNADLSPETAKYLMKKILRLYLEAVLSVVTTRSEDERLTRWWSELRSVHELDAENFTFPVTDSVHAYICNRLLVKAEARNRINRFRAYMDAISELLRNWDGFGPIDMRFFVAKRDELREALHHAATPPYAGVYLEAIIGEEEIRNLLQREFPAWETDAALEVLLRIVMAAVTERVDKVVTVTTGNIDDLLHGLYVPSVGVIERLGLEISQRRVEWLRGAADMIQVLVDPLVQTLATTEQPTTIEDLRRQLLSTTRERRGRDSIPHLMARRIGTQAVGLGEVDAVRIAGWNLRFTGNIYIAFGEVVDQIREMVGADGGCSRGIVFRPKAVSSSHKAPVECRVLLPESLRDRERRYSAAVQKEIDDRWDTHFRPLVEALVEVEDLDFFAAFVETLKVMMLLAAREAPHDLVQQFLALAVDWKTIWRSSIDLQDSDRRRWICRHLGFAETHSTDAVKRLITVLSGLRPGTERLAYSSAEEVAPRLHRAFREAIPRADEWLQQVHSEWASEWFVDDGRLIPYSRWPEYIRGRYELISRALDEGPMSFDDAGSLLYEADRWKIGVAEVHLHLFLKLGQLTSLEWELNDDRKGSYRQIVIEHRRRVLVQVRQNVEDALRSKLTSAVVSWATRAGREREKCTEGVEGLVRAKDALDRARSVGELDEVRQVVDDIRFPAPSIETLPRDFLDVPHTVDEAGRFFRRLSDILERRSPVAPLLTHRLTQIEDHIRLAFAIEHQWMRLQKLVRNAGLEEPSALPEDRLLAQVSRHAEGLVNDDPVWESMIPDEIESELRRKTWSIESGQINRHLSMIEGWLGEQVSRLVSEGWAETMTRRQLRSLSSQESRIKSQSLQKRDRLSAELEKELGDIARLREDALWESHRQELGVFETDLDNWKRALDRLDERMLYKVPFASRFEEAERALKSWRETYASMMAQLSEEIESWLREYGLEEFGEEIQDSYPLTRQSVSNLGEYLKLEERYDVVKALREGDTHRLLLIFAAAELFRHLRERSEP